MRYLFICFLAFLFLPGSYAQQVNVYERPARLEPSHDFDVLHYRIELNFEGEKRAFQGMSSVTLRVQSRNI